MNQKRSRKSPMLHMIDFVEQWGNKLPHPFWLFCILILSVVLLSEGFHRAGIHVTRPETQILKSEHDGRQVDGRFFEVNEDFDSLTIDMETASHSSRLKNLFVEVYSGENMIHEEAIDRSALRSFRVSKERFPFLEDDKRYQIRFVSRAEEVTPQSLLSREGLNWFVLNMIKNFAHFEPLGLVLVMLMGVAVAEGAGLIPTVMRGIALGVPSFLVIPVLFALAACGNIGSDAGIVVVPPLAAAIFKQLGKSPIAGLIVGYVGATAGFTANVLPSGTDVLAMSLTNAATGGHPEVNVFSNWFFMAISVIFLAILGTLVTLKYTIPRLESGKPAETMKIEPITAREKKAVLWAVIAIALATGLWMLTIVPAGGLLRNPDPNPALVWRSNFFKGLVPILFTLFVVGGIVYGKVAGTIRKADDVIGFMADAMRKMSGYIVLILVISQFTKIFQFARFDELIAVSGANLLRGLGMESFPIPFFVAFVIIIAVANMFMGSASAKWAIFAPIFVPMFMALGFHPAFTQLLYRLGDSITNCVSPLYPFFPVLLGWIADIDKEKAKVGTVLSYLVPYANILFWGWMTMLIIWYLLGLPVGPDSPVHLGS